MDISNSLSSVGAIPSVDSLALRSAARPTQRSATDSQIIEAGKEFESVFNSMLLKNMRSTISGEGMFAGDNSDTFGGMFDMFMSQHLAENNSLGIGTMIEGFLGNDTTESVS